MTTPDDRGGDCLADALGRSAEAASRSLTRWLGREATIRVCRARWVELAEAAEVLGPGEQTVAACALELTGGLPATVLMVLDERTGLALADALLGRAPGTAASWDEAERSAAAETANIVACALSGALAEGLATGEPVQPGPPAFRREFAASLLEFAVMDQAARGSRVLLVEHRFAVDGQPQDLTLLIVPSAAALDLLGVDPDRAGGDGEVASEGCP